MTGLEYAIWGFFGGFAVEGLEFAGAIRRTGDWPWRLPNEPGLLPFAVSVLIRLVVGAGLAVAAGSTGQISGPFGALGVGVAAPLLIEQLARQIPRQFPPATTKSLPADAESERPDSTPTSQDPPNPQTPPNPQAPPDPKDGTIGDGDE